MLELNRSASIVVAKNSKKIEIWESVFKLPSLQLDKKVCELENTSDLQEDNISLVIPNLSCKTEEENTGNNFSGKREIAKEMEVQLPSPFHPNKANLISSKGVFQDI